MAGVSKARLDLPRARLLLHFEPDTVHLSAVARWLVQFGYVAHPVRQQHTSQRSRIERSLLIKAGICWALAGNVMLFAFALYSGLNGEGDQSLLTGARWASFILAIISVAYGGSEFFRRAWASMHVAWRAREINRLHIDTPISIGILVGFGHSGWATITGQGDIWFDSITVLIAALLTARWLQIRSRRVAGDASDRLLSMIPTMARRITETESDAFELVRVDTLKRDDLIEVPAGEVFPVDGTIASGTTTINKAVLTGESRPEPAEPGSLVEAGATNVSTPVLVRVQATGTSTRVGKLLSWIRNQDSSKAQVVLLADQLSGYFVMDILLLAGLTAMIWAIVDPSQAPQHVVALLVISCPCALGMATPLAMAIAAGRAAQKGIFIKSDEAIQQLTEVDTIVLDKTGTLTTGSMEVVAVKGDAKALELAVQLETISNHPVARALMRYNPTCAASGPHLTEVETVAGKGIIGCIQGNKVVVGKPTWVMGLSSPSPVLSKALHQFALDGHTPIAIALNGQLAAGVAVGDKIREDARDLLDTLRAAGKDVYMLSGDHDAVVKRVAGTLDLPLGHAIGDASPEYKQAFVHRLQHEEGRTVAMVGEGVNDAVALQTAHVGIAVQGGSSPSLVAADVFMTSEGVRPIAIALRGTQRVMCVIHRNLSISLVYNVLGAGAAMLGLVTPLVAAIAMPISSILVVASSILQRSFKTPNPASNTQQDL